MAIKTILLDSTVESETALRLALDRLTAAWVAPCNAWLTSTQRNAIVGIVRYYPARVSLEMRTPKGVVYIDVGDSSYVISTRAKVKTA